MRCTNFLAYFVLGTALSTAHAFSLKVNFIQGTPAAIDFAYAVSTGKCAPKSPTDCHFEQSKLGGIPQANIEKFLTEINGVFKKMKPVADPLHQPTNFIEITTHGTNSICHINVLGKTQISVDVNQDGRCLVK